MLRPDPSAPSHRPPFGSLAGRAVAVAAVVGVAAMSFGGCAAKTDGGATTTTAAAAASSYATIDTLDKALIAAGIPCTLEYAGLKDDVSKVELSICTIDGEQAYLRVWEDPKMLQQFVASAEGGTGTVAVGANWSITVVTNPVAAKIAKAIGGTVPTAAATGSTTAR